MIINIAKINFKGTGGGSSDVIIKKLTIKPSNVEQVKDKTAKVDGYNPVVAPGYNVDDIYNTIITLNNGEYTPPTPPKDENRIYNGNVDVVGLRRIGWDDESIAELIANVWWYDWQDDYYKVNQKTIDLYDNTDCNPELYASDPEVIWLPNKNVDNYILENLYYIVGIPKTNNTFFASCDSLRFIAGLNDTVGNNVQFIYCSELNMIPKIDSPKYLAFNGCTSLVSVPNIILDKEASTVSNMFDGCTGLKYVPKINLNSTNVYRAEYMFRNCSALTEIPQIDLSTINIIDHIFDNCKGLTNVNNITIHSGAPYMFNTCSYLATVDGITSKNGGSMAYMFYNCNKLTTITNLKMSASYLKYAFGSTGNLNTVETITLNTDTSTITQLFGIQTSKPKLTRFIVDGVLNASVSDNYSFKALNAIDFDSVKSILMAASRTTNTNAKTLAFNRTMEDPDGVLQNIVTICNGKGWIITGLTLA